MNHYEKLRTMCHENLIGSEECVGCDGQKMQSKQHHDGDWEDRDCPTCKGAGYTMVTETLGKPLTLQDILRLLDTKQNYGTSKVLRTNGELRGVSEIGGSQIKEILFDIDLTKSIKDQDPEALQAIYEVVK